MEPECLDAFDESDATSSTSKHDSKVKKCKPGIIYLSVVPPFSTVKRIRDIFSEYGEVGRIFLQPKGNKKNKNRKFSEGWVEMKNKKAAKMISHILNNKQMGGKRKNKTYDFLWNIKYLHRFKWTHLNEKVLFEKAAREQQMRREISQVKRATDHYVQAVEKGKKLQQLERKLIHCGETWEERELDLKQRTVHEGKNETPIITEQVSVLTNLNIFGK